MHTHKPGASVTCLKCGYGWTPATAHPKACPNCKTYQWDEPYKRRPPKRTARMPFIKPC